MAQEAKPSRGQKLCQNEECQKVIAAAARTCPHCQKKQTPKTKKAVKKKAGPAPAPKRNDSLSDAEYTKLVLEMTRKLKETPRLNAERIIKQAQEVPSLDDVLTAGMAHKEMKEKILERERAKLIRKATKGRLEEIIKAIKENV